MPGTFGNHLTPERTPGGSVATLRALQAGHASTVVRQMAKAAERRVLLDLPGTLSASRDCLKVAEAEAHTGGLTVCGLLEASAKAAAGDLPAWAQLTMRTRERVQAVAARRGKVLGNVDVFSKVPDYAPLTRRAVPTVHAVRPGRIALHAGNVVVTPGEGHAGGEVGYPNMVTVQLEGTPTEMLLDTGSGLTIVRPGSLTTPAFMPWLSLSGIFGDSPARSALAQPERLQLGSLVIDHPLVSTSDDIPVNLLGMDVLSRLGRVVIGADSLQVLDPRQLGPECDAPLFSASTLVGTASTLRMFINVDGTRQEVMLDTGQSTELVRILPRGAALPAGEVRHSVLQGVQGQRRMQSVSQNVEVRTSGGKATLSMGTSVGEHPEKIRYVLGGGSLRKLSIYLDFIDRKACLLPASFTQAPPA